MMMFAVSLSAMTLSKISTLSLELMTMPDPAGTLATGVPSAPKLAVLLPTTSLLNTRVL